MHKQLRTDLRPATVPSREFWGITPFRFGVPDGWVARQTTDHLVHLQFGDDPSTNCSIDWKRVSPALGLQRIASMNLALMQRRYEKVSVGASSFGTIDGRKVYTRVAKLTQTDPTSGEELSIGQSYTAFFGPIIGDDLPIELFEIVGQFPFGDLARVEDLEQFTLSFQFNVGLVDAVRAAGENDEVN